MGDVVQTAHDLARYAALAADYICVGDVKAFSTERGLEPGIVRVTFHMTSGATLRYTVTLEKEADAPNGESGPSSPQP